ncbi:uncharacterized protein LOC119120863 [Syngnathus acus]|uniref:uncharacterized protein LOC119120863 n=1 Tax=Syngnathus acus TaxID=161584 RepID=UPI0018864F69|nr:uncharacterized protein LOC119120863 [Syngnathus acus]
MPRKSKKAQALKVSWQKRKNDTDSGSADKPTTAKELMAIEPENSMEVMMSTSHDPVTCVLASYSQDHPKYADSRNSQCAANSATFLAFLQEIDNVTSAHLDLVLDRGNELYVATVAVLKAEGRYEHHHLATDEIPSIVNGFHKQHVLIKYQSMYGLFNSSIADVAFMMLCDGLQCLVSEVNYALLVMNSLFIAVFRNHQGRYGYFDPHTRERDGLPLPSGAPRGTAVMMLFTCLNDLIDKLIQVFTLAGAAPTTQYELMPVSFQPIDNASDREMATDVESSLMRTHNDDAMFSQSAAEMTQRVVTGESKPCASKHESIERVHDNSKVGQQRAIRGNVVCVPSEVEETVNVLPRLRSRSQVLRVKLKRRLCYKGHQIFQTVTWSKLMSALIKLKQIHPQYSNITIRDDADLCDPTLTDDDSSSDEDEMNESDYNEEDLEAIHTFERDALCELNSDSQNDPRGNVQKQQSAENVEEGDAPNGGVILESCLQPNDVSEEIMSFTQGIYCVAPAERNNPFVTEIYLATSSMRIQLRKDAPVFEEASEGAICGFVSRYISAQLPDPEKEPELYKKVTEVQMHSKSHSKSCVKHQGANCRFGFPKPPCETTMIITPAACENQDRHKEKQVVANDKLVRVQRLLNEPETSSLTLPQLLAKCELTDAEYMECLYMTASKSSVVLKRDPKDCWVNNYNRHLLLAWDANLDIQYILNAYSCIAYICSYISKAEHGLSQYLKSVIENSRNENVNESDEMKQIMQAYSKKREVKGKNVLPLLNDMGFVKKRKEKAAVIKYCKFSEQKNPEEYYCSLLKLYLPHRANCQLKSERCPSYQLFHDHACVQLPYNDSVERVCEIVKRNRERYEKHSKDIDDAIQEVEESGLVINEWCHLAPESELQRLECIEESNARDEPNDNVEENVPDYNVRSETSEISIATEAAAIDPAVLRDMYRNLNQKQASVFYKVRDWCIKRVCNSKPIEQFFYYINGGAGTGKSHLIKCIHAEATKILHRLPRLAEEADISKQTVVLAAFTGTAAFSISGTTLHSLLKLPRSLKPPYHGLGNKLDEVRAELSIAEILIIDEISMVSKDLFAYVNARLKQIKGIDLPFGGMSVLAVGDFFQLPPVKQSKPLCVYDPTRLDHWRDTFKKITLTAIMRQRDDVAFAELLNRLRVKEKSDELSELDRALLATR